MLCPICSTVRLRPSRHDGISLWRCPDCGGVWLEEALVAKLRDSSPQQPHAPRLAETAGGPAAATQSFEECPKHAPFWQEVK